MEHGRILIFAEHLGNGFPKATEHIQALIKNRKPVSSTLLRSEALNFGGGQGAFPHTEIREGSGEEFVAGELWITSKGAIACGGG
jgi:hypothetical protein